MASFDNNPVLRKGTSFRVGSWIFVANRSGGFESYSIDQDPPEASEVVKRHEFDESIDQLKGVRLSDLDNEARIQPEFDAIKAKRSLSRKRIWKNYWKIPSKKLP